ncbi:MAG TPA: DinB family protein [Longimicrobiales bacterium]
MKMLRMAVLAAATLAAAPLAAQEHGQHGQQAPADHADHHAGPPPYIAAIAGDLAGVERKLIALAEAIPEERWDWRPGAGVRSIGEVFMHIAADNYFFPAMVGEQAPAETGIRGDDFNTAVAYERREMNKAQTIEALRASFAFLHEHVGAVSHDELHATHSFFGNQMTGIQIWLAATTHLHEHLGQSIAYARSVGVTPPWSNGN